MRMISKAKKAFTDRRWMLGITEVSLGDIIDGKSLDVHWVEGQPRDRWFADPFILDYTDDTIEIMAEEKAYVNERGRIAWLSVNRHNWRLEEYKIVLDLDTHLSFPVIKREGNEIFIYPENSASGSLYLYHFNRKEKICQKVRTLSKYPLTDAIMTNLLGKEKIFSTRISDPNGRVLGEYDADGEYEKDIMFGSNIARNGGDWFCFEGKIYRPAQDCTVTYGGGIILQEVHKDGDVLSFTNIRRINSTHPVMKWGCHTFNTYKDLSVIDVWGWRYKAYHWLQTIRNKS